MAGRGQQFLQSHIYGIITAIHVGRADGGGLGAIKTTALRENRWGQDDWGPRAEPQRAG